MFTGQWCGFSPGGESTVPVFLFSYYVCGVHVQLHVRRVHSQRQPSMRPRAHQESPAPSLLTALPRVPHSQWKSHKAFRRPKPKRKQVGRLENMEGASCSAACTTLCVITRDGFVIACSQVGTNHISRSRQEIDGLEPLEVTRAR